MGPVILFNFAVMLTYLILAGIMHFDGGDINLRNAFQSSAEWVVVHAGVNIFVGFILIFTPYRQVGASMLLSAFLIGLMGLGLCVASDVSPVYHSAPAPQKPS